MSGKSEPACTGSFRAAIIGKPVWRLKSKVRGRDFPANASLTVSMSFQLPIPGGLLSSAPASVRQPLPVLQKSAPFAKHCFHPALFFIMDNCQTGE
jgi:hypothetical protein